MKQRRLRRMIVPGRLSGSLKGTFVSRVVPGTPEQLIPGCPIHSLDKLKKDEGQKPS